MFLAISCILSDNKTNDENPIINENHNINEDRTENNPEIPEISWYNNSELVFISSTDNGTTWEPPYTITTADQISAPMFNPSIGIHPTLEIGILENETIYVITETTDPNYTPLIYFESSNNGTTWDPTPKNVTVSKNHQFLKELEHS